MVEPIHPIRSQTVAAYHGVRRLTATLYPGNLASVRLLRHVGLCLHAVDGLLEGTTDLRLPNPPRLDREAVLDAAVERVGDGVRRRA